MLLMGAVRPSAALKADSVTVTQCNTRTAPATGTASRRRVCGQLLVSCVHEIDKVKYDLHVIHDTAES